MFGPKGTCILRKVTYPVAPSRLLRISHERLSRQRVRQFFCSRQRAWSKSSLRQRVQHMAGHLPKASCVVWSKAKTHWTLFRKPEKHVFFSTSSLARGAQQTTWRQRVQHEVPRKALGAKGYSTKCRKEHLAPKLPGLFHGLPRDAKPRAKHYGAKSAKKVRAKQYVTFLFGANLPEANLARAKQYSTNWSLVCFGLSRQTVRDFSKRTRKSPCFTLVLTFLNFFARRLAPRELAFSPGKPFPLEVGDEEYVSKIGMSCSVWPEAKKLRILVKKTCWSQRVRDFSALASWICVK